MIQFPPAIASDPTNMDEASETAAVLLAEELSLLTRLLSRNRSQHGSSKYFGALSGVLSACKGMRVDRVPPLMLRMSSSCASVQGLHGPRQRRQWAASAVKLAVAARWALSCISRAASACLSCTQHLRGQLLSQSHFLTLAITFMACSGRILLCITCLADGLEARLSELEAAVSKVPEAELPRVVSTAKGGSALIACRLATAAILRERAKSKIGGREGLSDSSQNIDLGQKMQRKQELSASATPHVSPADRQQAVLADAYSSSGSDSDETSKERKIQPAALKGEPLPKDQLKKQESAADPPVPPLAWSIDLSKSSTMQKKKDKSDGKKKFRATSKANRKRKSTQDTTKSASARKRR
jgi:hypothetical protein